MDYTRSYLKDLEEEIRNEIRDFKGLDGLEKIMDGLARVYH
jgi:hypothetical protein